MSDRFGCVGNTIRLRSGLYFDIKDPRPDQFVFSDISGALSKICRFGSQAPVHYSVAEHLVHCYEQSKETGWGPLASRMVLLHDASEAFVGDCVKPLKLMLPAYSAIEDRIGRVIYEKYGVPKFGLEYCHEHHVKPIDRNLLIWEKRFLFGENGEDKWEGEGAVPPCPIEFRCYDQEQAEFWYAYCAEQAGIDTNW